MSDVAREANDGLLQATCEAIVMEAVKVISAEPVRSVRVLRLPNGFEVGRQITIDATEKGGLMNICRLSGLNPDVAPEGEVVRIEFEHDKEGKFGVHHVYSVQSVRRQGRELVLLENFLAENPQMVREADFRPILSEAYAQETVLKSLQDWTKYRAWQRQASKRV